MKQLLPEGSGMALDVLREGKMEVRRALCPKPRPSWIPFVEGMVASTEAKIKG
jgi:hypothetical protein